MLNILRFIKTIAVLTGVISHTAHSLLLMGAALMLVFNGFVAIFITVYGPYLKDFRDVKLTYVSLLSSMLGKFDQVSQVAITGAIGKFLFAAYSSCMVFFLLNLFVAIICEGAAELSSESGLDSDDFKMTGFILQKLQNFLFSTKRPQLPKKPPKGDLNCHVDLLVFQMSHSLI